MNPVRVICRIEEGESVTLIEYLNSQFSLMQVLDFCGRLLLSCLLGGIIGYERSKRFKEAGIRTHIIVCCGAALLMIVSKYGFADLTAPGGGDFNGVRGADPARVAAQVVSGISFLGAGVIFKNGGTIKGLTTAAMLWFTAGIGLAVGAGMIWIAVVGTLLVCSLQMLLHRFAVGADAYAANRLHFVVKNGYDFNTALMGQLESWGAQITESKVNRRRDGVTEYELTVRRRTEITYAEMKGFMESREDILSSSNSPIR